MSAAADQRENWTPIDAAELGECALGILSRARLRAGKNDAPARRLELFGFQRIAAAQFRFHAWR